MGESGISRDAARGSTIGLLIGTAFGLWWFIGGALALGGAASTVLIIVCIALAVYIGVSGMLVWRRSHSLPASNAPSPFASRAYRASVLIEIIGIPVAARLLTAQGLPQFITPVIAVIVGLHLFGVAWAFGQRALMLVGGAMCVLALLTVLVLPVSAVVGEPPRTVAVWSVAVGLGNGTLFVPGCASGMRQLYRAVSRTTASAVAR